MIRLVIVVGFVFVSKFAVAQTFDERFDRWPVDLKINGRIVVAGELNDLRFLRRSLRPSDLKKKTAILVDSSVNDETRSSLKELFDQNEQVSIVDADGSSKQFQAVLSDNEILVWYSRQALTEETRAAVIQSQTAFANHIQKRGILAIIGPASEVVSKYFMDEQSIRPPERTGLNLTPDCVIETNFADSPGDRNRLLSVLAAHPRCVGIGLEKDTLLILAGRKMQVLGDGRARFLLMANDRSPIRSHSIQSSQFRRLNPEEAMVDLTQWRRDAIDRTLPPFPPAEPKTPFIENGTLLIVGGGSMPEGLMARMVELAGGADEARMVYVPCSENENVGEEQRTVESWKKMGVKHATFIHTKDRNRANIDEQFLAPLKDATGIWFGGGRQWNMADSYYGTRAHKLMKDVLKRGGVIGGSSAGASIQARYLARATPIQNFKIMAFGYERGGLGFISGVAIDQHFSRRGRQKDMTTLVNRYPQLLGIGIDEGTALIVQKSQAKIVGKGKVHFYDRNLPVYPDQPDFIALPKGSEYDLAERKVLTDATEEAAEEKPEP